MLLLIAVFAAPRSWSQATYPATDSFSGSGALSSNWTNVTASGFVALSQNSGTVKPSVSGGTGMAAYTGTAFASDQYAQATFVNHSAAGGITAVCVRTNIYGTGVCWVPDWGTTYGMQNGATFSLIIGGCPIPASGDTVELLAVGHLYTCKDVTTGASASGWDVINSLGSPAIIVDQTYSNTYALAAFQADCIPSCGSFTGSGAASYPLTDTFSGSGALSSNWIAVSNNGYQPLSQNGGAVQATSGQAGLEVYTGAVFSSDQYSQAAFNSSYSSGNATGVCVRMDASGDGVCYLAPYGVMYDLASGGGLEEVTSCPVPSNGDVIRLSVVGDIYTCADLTSGASDIGVSTLYGGGYPAVLVDQRSDTADSLSSFQADCVPSCSNFMSPPVTIQLGSYASTVANPGFANTATVYVPGSSTVNNGSTATYPLDWFVSWHAGLNSSTWVSYDPGTAGGLPTVSPPNGDYYFTTTFNLDSNVPVSQAAANLTVLADDSVSIYLNGTQIFASLAPSYSYGWNAPYLPNYTTPLTFNFSGLVAGQNTLAFDVKQIGNYGMGLDYIGSISYPSSTPSVTISPGTTTLYANNTQQFTATVSGLSSSAVTWSLSPSSGAGTISSSGLYTAPSSITTTQTVTVTATSQANSSYSATASITLMPTITISVAPGSATLYSAWTQQFTASVTGTSNASVTWSISPSSGAGSINSSGLYSAPATITSSQTVTITATSVANPSASASATVTLNPQSCTPSNGYSYGRIVAIDHRKVPNTDQTNFPVLISGTYPFLATVANGGKVQNTNGYDIIFTSDAAGTVPLDFEIDNYNATTGTAVFWVRIPTLSHTTDTTIYMWYGNASVASSQANPTAVWDANYKGVWHAGNGTVLSLSDSTSNGNNAVNNGATAGQGEIGGGIVTNGTSYATIGTPGSLANLAQGNATFSAWVNTATGAGGRLMARDDGNGSEGWALGVDNQNLIDFVVIYSNSDFRLSSSQPISSGNWSFVTVTLAGNANAPAQATVYINGTPAGTGSGGNGTTTDDSAQTAYLANATYGDRVSHPLNGSADEFRISNVIRSADWIATEYNNQSSPSTFYTMLAENTVGLTPTAVGLYASQNLQFNMIPFGACTASPEWSESPTGYGTISSSGLYTAPAIISSQQTITIAATPPGSAVNSGMSTVVLLPDTSHSILTLTPSASSPYSAGSTQSFVANLTDPAGVPESGVTVTFAVSGVNPQVTTAITNGSGMATLTYVGANSGTDTIQATVVANGEAVSSNTLSITWIPFISPNGSFSLVLSPAGPPATLGLTGLCGAFTDGTGAVVEPLAIGGSPRVFTVPAGATQLQLGVVDDRYGDNGGTGFLVDVDGIQFTVAPTTMPWLWVSGGLNTNFQFGIQDGTNPIIAATSLVPGQAIAVTYKSGTVDAGFGWPTVGANGDQSAITGTSLGTTHTHHPTNYMFDLTEPAGQSIQFTGTVENGSGNPVSGTAVTFNISGANAQSLSATTGANGDAVVSYTGTVAGIDTIQAQATPSGSGALTSGTTTLLWIPAPSPAPATLVMTPASASPGTLGGSVTFTVQARDASGVPLVGLAINFGLSGADNAQVQVATNSSGEAQFIYHNGHAGTSTLVAVALVDSTVVYSNSVATTWNASSGGGGGGSGSSGGININIQTNPTVTLPNSLQLNGTVTDTSGTPTLIWSQLAGPGTATFGNTSQANTTATFTVQGDYVLQLSANDGTNSAAAQVAVTVNPSSNTQGWIGSPANGSTLTGIVPITTASGVSIASGRLIYYSAEDPYAQNPTVLNANVSGSGQIGTLDTTAMANGSYYVQLQATDTNGNSEYSVALVNVVGQYKPGRVTTTVTDLVVPAKGLAINIQRQYDSLNANSSRDFGFGWSLGTNVDLSVDASNNVTFTINGQRRTFYFTPQFQFFFGGDVGAYTPEPGFAGSLTPGVDSIACPFGYIVPIGTLWQCASGALWNPVGYVYTDPNGTQYTMTASGGLQSIKDIGGNTLTITSNGITSSTGLSVPFVRDSSGRITKITDPQGNEYDYTYDTSGNLSTVKYPGITQTSTYTYDSSHLYLSGTDFRGNALPTTAYFGPSDVDVNNLPLNGRLKSVTDALSETTSYAYNLATNTTTITYPADGSGHVGTATMVYDSYGMLTASTDPNGLTTTNTYDPSHHLIAVTDPIGNKTTYAYDAQGNRTSTTYPRTSTSVNTTSTVLYNQNSEPTTSTDELGNTRTYNYDANSWPTSVTDSIGTLTSSSFNADGTMHLGAIGFDISANPSKESTFAYDAYGNRTSSTDALDRQTQYVYNTLGQKTSMIEPYASPATATQATTTYTYDALGHLTQTAAPLGRTTSSTYDANGNKTSDTDADGNITSYSYDALNRLLTTTYPTSPATTVTNTYDFRGNILTQTDQAGNVTKNVYDVGGRLTLATKAYGTANASTTTYTYDGDGRKLTEADPAGHVTRYVYDQAGRMTSATSGYGTAGASTTSYGYDDAGNRTSMTDGNSHTTAYQYDARKRLTQTTYPDSTTVTNTYDGPGNLASVTDQAGNTVSYAYDAANQLATVVQNNSPNTGQNTTSYVYDLLGDLGSVQDANSHTTVNTYDLLSELSTKTLPDGTSVESRGYDYAGNLTSLTHFSVVQTTYGYDSLNRLTSRATPGETTVSFTYTATGKRHTMTDASGTTTYSYDSMDRLTAKATPEGTLNYTYNSNGKVASITSSNVNGASISYTYDSLNRLSTVVDNRLPSGANTTTYTYDLASNVVTVTYPNGLQSTLAYDFVNRLTSLATVTGSSSPVASYNYAPLGATGIRTQAAEAYATNSGADTRNVTWGYDGIYRLTGETIANDSSVNGTVSYALDPVGNRTQTTSSVTGINSTPTIGFNADDLLTSGEAYDANGNTTSTGGRSFSYDSENHLVSMNSGAVTLVYDGDGNRVAKTVSGVTTQYLVDDLNPTGYPQVMEEVQGGTVQRTYTYGLQRISEEQIISSAWTPSFYGYDGGGSVRQLTNSSGTVTDTYNYDAFGTKLNSTGSTPNNYLYRGEQYDPDLGLYYLRARYYNPFTGRFLSRDPARGHVANPISLHKYLYSEEDPINRKDPSGRAALVEYVVMNIGVPTGKCVANGEGSIGKCLASSVGDALEDNAEEIRSGRIPHPGANSAEAFGKQVGGCVIDAYEGIGNILNSLFQGDAVSEQTLSGVGSDLEKCAYESINDELGDVITWELIPDPPGGE